MKGRSGVRRQQAQSWKRSAQTLALLAALGLASPAPLWAQDESNQRADVINRYKQLLEASPSEGFVFQQLLKEVGLGQQLDKLIEEYKQKADAEPKKVAYRLIYAHLLKAARRTNEAIDAYRQATEADPRSVDAWLGLGQALEQAKRPEEAAPAMEKALGLVDNKDRKLDILRNLADSSFARNDFDGADRAYKQMLELAPSDDYLRQEYARALKGAKRYEQALQQYEELLRRSGRNVKDRATYMKEVGEVLALLGRGDEAIAKWREAMKLVVGDNYLAQEMEQLIIGVYRDRNDLASLLAYYQQAWKSPSYEQAMVLASLHDELGHEDEALTWYKNALARNRSSIDAQLKILRILERRGDTPGVIKAYQDLIKIDGSQPSYQFELAELYWREGDKKKATATADDISRRFASNPDVQINLADLYFRWGMNDKVLTQYEKLVRIAPSDPTNFIGLGEYYWQEGDRKKAVEIWKKILTSLPDKGEAHATLGQVYAEHNMTAEAVAEYKEAIKADPNNDGHRRSLATTYEHARDMGKAIEAWEDVLKTTKKQPLRREARSRIVQILLQQNALRPRLGNWKKAFDATPPNVEDGYFLCEAYIALKDWVGAERSLRRLLELKPDDQEALLALNKVYNETGDHAQNIEVLKKLADLNPLRARDLYHQIAELSLKLYDDQKAVEFASLAVDLNPGDPAAHARLGKIYGQMQELERAVREYRTAIDLDPQAYQYYFELAELHLALDQVPQADALYRQVVGRCRDESFVLRAGRKSVDINDALGSLEVLEQQLAPLIVSQPTQKVFGRLLIELYDRMTRSLIAAADYGDPAARQKAELELDAISRRALGPLLAALRDDDPSIKLTAIRILGDLRNGNAALPLARLIEERDPTARVPAALGAGRLGDKRIVPPMLKALEDPDPTLRQIAVWSLGRTSSKDAVEPLRKILDTDPDWAMRALAAMGLGRLGDPKAVEVLSARLASPTTLDARPEVRVAAAWGLGALGDPKAQNALLAALRDDKDPQVRRMAAWAIGNVGAPGALDGLLEAALSGSPEVREVAGKALLRLAPGPDGRKAPYVVWEENLGFYDLKTNQVDVTFFLRILLSDELLARAGDGSEAILQGEKTLSRLLLQQLNQPAPADLLATLRDLDQRPASLSLGALTWNPPADPKRAAQTEQALTRIGASLAPRLIMLLKHEDPAVRALSAGVLGKIGDKAAVEPLLAALADPQEEVRRRACGALGQLGDPRAVEPLLARLADPAWLTRGGAASALGRLKDGRALGPLTQALDDKFTWVQASAAEGLGQLGDPKAVPALVAHLDAAPAPVRREILQSLLRIGGPEAQKTLDRFPNDPSARDLAP